MLWIYSEILDGSKNGGLVLGTENSGMNEPAPLNIDKYKAKCSTATH